MKNTRKSFTLFQKMNAVNIANKFGIARAANRCKIEAHNIRSWTKNPELQKSTAEHFLSIEAPTANYNSASESETTPKPSLPTDPLITEISKNCDLQKRIEQLESENKLLRTLVYNFVQRGQL